MPAKRPLSSVQILKYLYIFSLVRNGLGFALTIFGILWLLSVFHRKLHSIREQPSTRNSPILRYLSSKFVIFCIVVTFIIGVSTLFPFHESPNIYFLHINNILIVTIVAILIPKYYINQDPNMKLYVSVYHCQPPPVLPWQLPRNFNHNSVKLICVSHKNE